MGKGSEKRVVEKEWRKRSMTEFYRQSKFSQCDVKGDILSLTFWGHSG